tara:strand:+ start:273 stop:1712 length:1440 start_codon:yes stop_codon:yes gene_type:complete
MKNPILHLATFFSICIAAQAESPAEFRAWLAEIGVTPTEPKPDTPKPKIELGRALFFDPIIGGNQDVSCSTCHHPRTGTSDGRSRAVGTQAYVSKGRRLPQGLNLIDIPGGEPVLTGFNLNRVGHPFTPRNSPDCFNRGDSEWHTMFWDGRVHLNENNRFAVNNMRLTKSPGHYQVVLPKIVENVLAAQAMMPVLSNDEMRGTKGQTGAGGVHNEVGEVLQQNEEEIWAALMKRLLVIPEYVDLFQEAYPGSEPDELHFAHAANAIAAFEIDAFTFHDSPWDRFLAGEDDALASDALAGARLFYGKANCSQCHTGRLMTDQKMHNMAVVPIGPGPHPEEDADFGVAHRSNAGLDEKYAFRTTPLRNVELTGPYMHNGAYKTLEEAVRQQLDPIYHLENYDLSQLEPEFRGAVHNDKNTIRDVKRTFTKHVEFPVQVSDAEVDQLVSFLKSLTSPSARDLDHIIPESVPSGLEMVVPFVD